MIAAESVRTWFKALNGTTSLPLEPALYHDHSSPMSIPSLDVLHKDGIETAVVGGTLLGQTLSYGIYAALFPFAVWITIHRGLPGFMNKSMFALMLVSFFIATGYFIFSAISWFVRVQRNFISFVPPEQRPINSVTKFVDLWNAIVLINVALTDGAVLWRAWVICNALRKSRVVLIIALVTLVLCFLSAFVCIGVRSAVIYKDIKYHSPVDEPSRLMLVYILQLAQLTAPGFSLLTNILATGCIGARVWSLWREFSNLAPPARQFGANVNDILFLFIESGFIYCLSSTFFLVGRFINLPMYSLATYYQPIHINISAMYPAILLVLVNQKREMKWETQAEKPSDMGVSFGLQDSFIMTGYVAGDAASSRTDSRTLNTRLSTPTKLNTNEI
ncbi:hypothetical protein DL96DRAFT_1597585 [Flagelloscypha sp. PMI_526]|nr:hypothetical protein DL96DRAFT_1597585 [Flagelloscypha sp. PMI_526]